MSDNDRSVGVSTSRLRRPERSVRSKAHAAKRDADEAGQYLSAAQRETHREIIRALPPLRVERLAERLPYPIITHLSVDDVCKETMVIVDLLNNDNIEII